MGCRRPGRASLDAYLPTVEAAERSARARDLLLGDCLGRFGLRWQKLGAAELRHDRLMMKGRRTGRFGLVDEGQARRYGYHPPPWSPQHPDARREHRDSAVSADVRAVLFGTVGAFGGKAVPRGGCVQEAERALSSGVRWDGDPALVSKLEQEADAQADVDPRKQELFRRWSSCMRRAGLAYGVPRDAVHDRRWWPDLDGRPGTDELKVAIADVGCKREVRYLDTAAAVTAVYQRRLIGAHADALGRLRHVNDVRARRVEQVLEQHEAMP
jgi:hypothetical protein